MGLLMLWRKKQTASALGVKVLLSGLGGDELFLGRLHYFADLLRRGRISSLCRELRSFHPYDRSTGRRTQLTTLFVDYAVSPLLPRRLKHFAGRYFLGRPPVGAWIHPELARRTLLDERIRNGPSRIYDDLYRQYCYDVFSYELLAMTLPIHDALNAAFALDTRFPLLDQRLVEYLFAVPREQKIGNGHVRILQRKAMDGILPEIVLREHLKKNFHPAMERQQRGHFLAELEDVLRRPRPLSEDYLDWHWLRSSYRQQLHGAGWYPLWFALNLERWLEGLAGKTPSSRRHSRDAHSGAAVTVGDNPWQRGRPSHS
jgi:asparagine synthase (glutamine-hydrolysing)